MSKHPKFLKNVQPEEPVQRYYHGKPVQLWKGEVHFSDVRGWADNPRIHLEMQQWRAEQGGGEISQDQLYALMRNTKEVHLRDLQQDIIKNGLREPIVLSFEGRLIDGNRRFFAIRSAIEGRSAQDSVRDLLENIPAFVMMRGATEKDAHRVLVEENFSSSLKEEWPFLVKARIIKEAYDNSAADKISDKKKEVADAYGWSVGAVTKTLKIWDIIESFKGFVTTKIEDGGMGLSEMEAERLAQEKYQSFSDASTVAGFLQALNTDYAFSEHFFRCMAEGKYRNWQEVRVAHQVWQDPEARAEMEKGGADAGKNAKAIVDYKSRIVRDESDVANRIDNFVKFLKSLTTEQKERMPQESMAKLEQALEIVLKMAQKARPEKR